MEPAKHSNVIRVAIADDHAVLKGAIKMVLSFYKDIEVVGDASNGQELLDLLPAAKADVVLLDLQMPVLDGVSTLPHLRQRFPHVKVIILSMHNDSALMARLLETGANSYLMKDSDPATIYSTIRSSIPVEEKNSPLDSFKSSV